MNSHIDVKSISRRSFCIGMAATFPSWATAVSRVTPRNLHINGHFVGIIDIYDENDKISLDEAWRLNVRAIMNETGMGLFKKDRAYAARKQKALDKGFMWGAFHLMSAESVDDQLARFLEYEDGSNANVAMALDWEPSSRGDMTYENLRSMVEKFHARLKFYPMLYCDSRVREIAGIMAGDPLLGRCPLWYARPRRDEAGLQIPEKTWKSGYTLWQFDDQDRNFNAPYKDPKILPGADWSSFKGTEADLRKAWPFRAA